MVMLFLTLISATLYKLISLLLPFQVGFDMPVLLILHRYLKMVTVFGKLLHYYVNHSKAIIKF